MNSPVRPGTLWYMFRCYSSLFVVICRHESNPRLQNQQRHMCDQIAMIFFFVLVFQEYFTGKAGFITELRNRAYMFHTTSSLDQTIFIYFMDYDELLNM